MTEIYEIQAKKLPTDEKVTLWIVTLNDGTIVIRDLGPIKT